MSGPQEHLAPVHSRPHPRLRLQSHGQDGARGHLLLCATCSCFGANTTDKMSLSVLIDSDPPATSVAIATDMPDPSDVALMLLSGGTTALRSSFLVPTMTMSTILEQSARVAALVPDRSAYCPALWRTTTISVRPGCLGAIASGGRVVIAPKADLRLFLHLSQRARDHDPAAVPLFVNWLNDPTSQVRRQARSRTVQNGGARLSPELRDRAR